MIIRILDGLTVVDSVHATITSANKFVLTRAIRSGAPGTTFATPPAGAHAYSFSLQTEAGDAAATPQVTIQTGYIVVERVKR
jgi:hypothetical protein